MENNSISTSYSRRGETTLTAMMVIGYTTLKIEGFIVVTKYVYSNG